MNNLRILTLAALLLCVGPHETVAGNGTTPVTGTVSETMVSGGYVYMKVDENGHWLATSPLDRTVYVGDKVEYSGGMEMRNFYSKTLDRTFASVYFVQNVKLLSQEVNAIQQQAMVGQDAHRLEIPRPVKVASPEPGEIAPLEGGRTIAGLFAASNELDEQVISLRARVIKVSPNIMDRNWVTLQDGTGSAPNDRLLATSAELVTAGDTVIAKGIVRKDMDIGSGYTYDVLLEEATFSQD